MPQLLFPNLTLLVGNILIRVLNVCIEAWTFGDYCSVMQTFINQSVKELNRVGFELLDSNKDGLISEIDLFVALTLQDKVTLTS